MKKEQWRKQAACLGASIDVFVFAEDKKYDKTSKLGALEYCDQCPVVWDLSLIHISEPTRPY